MLIDDAYPIAMFDEAGKERVRTQFRRLGPIMRILAAFGCSARMSPAEAEASNKRPQPTAWKGERQSRS